MVKTQIHSWTAESNGSLIPFKHMLYVQLGKLQPFKYQKQILRLETYSAISTLQLVSKMKKKYTKFFLIKKSKDCILGLNTIKASFLPRSHGMPSPKKRKNQNWTIDLPIPQYLLYSSDLFCIWDAAGETPILSPYFISVHACLVLCT